MNGDNQDTLKPKEAAQFLGCSEYKIKELARTNEIPHYRIGVRIMFRKSSLMTWIENQEKQNYSV